MTTFRLNNQFPTAVNSFFRNLENVSSIAKQPAINVLEHANSFQIEVMAPGFKKEDFTINLQKNKLTIAAIVEPKENETEEKAVINEVKLLRQEFIKSEFERSFVLPQTIDGEKIEATYLEGILTLTLPKKEEALEKEPKLIAVA